MNLFVVRENFDGKWQIVMSEIPFSEKGRLKKGSYNILPARLLGFSYPDYLRFCRDKYRGELRNREGYSYCVFKGKEDCAELCSLLNKEWGRVEEKIKQKLNDK